MIGASVSVPALATSLARRSGGGGGGGGGGEEPAADPVVSDFVTGSYTADGAPSSIAAIFRQEPNYMERPIPVATPGVGAEAPLAGFAGAIQDAVAAPFIQGGVLIVTEAIMNTTNSLSGSISRTKLEFNLTDMGESSGMNDAWTLIVKRQSGGGAPVTTTAELWDYGSVYEQINFDAPDGVVRMAGILTPDGIKLAVNGVSIESSAPLTPNTDRNAILFEWEETRAGAGAGTAELIVKSFEMRDPTGVTVEKLRALSSGAMLDFANDIYILNGEDMALADLAVSAVSNAPPIPAGWFSAQGMTPASGNDQYEGLNFIGDLATLLLGVSTVVIDFTMPAVNVQHSLSYGLIDSFESYNNGQVAFVTAPNDGAWSSAEANIGTFSEGGTEDTVAFFNEANALVVGANRLVVCRRADGTLAASLNGSPVVVAGNLTVPQTLPVLDAGDFSGGGGHVLPTFQRMKALKGAMTNAQMIAASTV